MESMQQALGVLFVLALLGATLWWLRRKGVAQFALKAPALGKRRNMQVIERMALTPQHSLHLVRVAEKTMLIAASPSGCSILEGFAGIAAERMEIR